MQIGQTKKIKFFNIKTDGKYYFFDFSSRLYVRCYLKQKLIKESILITCQIETAVA